MSRGAAGHVDLLWLADALRAAELDVAEFPHWRTRGHGQFADVRGIMLHHTGSDASTAASIAQGRPDLAGPLSNVHIARTGTVTVVAAGVAWHAGRGECSLLPPGTGNGHTIGVECANSGTAPGARHRQNWPDAQYAALTRACAALCLRLALPVPRVIGHREYAGRAQGKWDPGAIDLDVLRHDVSGELSVISGAADVVQDRTVAAELVRGSTGAQVAELQRRLRYAYAAYAGGLRIDGVFGTNTEAAVREFQCRTIGLVVDGIVGPSTAAALLLRQVSGV